MQNIKIKRETKRLRFFDYTTPGAYFVTVCTHKRECLFGRIIVDKMQLNEYGRIVLEQWRTTGQIRSSVEMDKYVIMPNHLHIVFTPLPKSDGSFHSMSAIMHSLKTYTAGKANVMLGREGEFWQHENYDHVVRDEAEWGRIINYVVRNPVAAGLVRDWKDWNCTYCKHPL